MKTAAFLTPQETEVDRGSVLRSTGSVLSLAVLQFDEECSPTFVQTHPKRLVWG